MPLLYSNSILFLLTIDHELCHNKNGLLGDDSVQSHQSFVLQLLHQVRFLQKGLRLHRSLLQGLYGNFLGALVVTCRRDSNNSFFIPPNVLIYFYYFFGRCLQSPNRVFLVPIQTSPNCPAPSFFTIFSVSLGISHWSCSHGC